MEHGTLRRKGRPNRGVLVWLKPDCLYFSRRWTGISTCCVSSSRPTVTWNLLQTDREHIRHTAAAADLHALTDRSSSSHEDVVPLHDAAQVLVAAEDPVEPVVVDVRHDHLDTAEEAQWMNWRSADDRLLTQTLTFSAETPDRADSDAHRSEMQPTLGTVSLYWNTNTLQQSELSENKPMHDIQETANNSRTASRYRILMLTKPSTN